MPAISHTLKQQILRQIDEHGIVIWYDGEHAYSHLIENWQADDFRLMVAGDSLFAVRHEVEPLLEFIEPNGEIRHDCDVASRLLVYVPRDRSDCAEALIELECAGVVMEPGSSDLDRNTRLQVIAERYFQRETPEKAAHIGRQVAEGLIGLTDLDQMAEDVSQVSSGGLKLVFGQTAPTEVTLLFLASDGFDKALGQKKAWEELQSLFEKEYGATVLEGLTGSDLRTTLARQLLATELGQRLSEESVPASVKSVSLAANAVQKDLVSHTCRQWRQRMDLRESYISSSLAVEAELKLEGCDLSSAAEAESFRAIDVQLLETCISSLEKKDFPAALSMAEKRQGRFWAIVDAEIGMSWRFLREATDLLLRITECRKDLKKAAPDLAGWIQAYTSWTRPVMKVDQIHRRLEVIFDTLQASSPHGVDPLEKVLVICRHAYRDFVDESARSFSHALEAALQRVQEIFTQRSLFGSRVKRLLESHKKVAYLLVDALRYEMAAELTTALAGEFTADLQAVIGQLPGITPVGMAALMPGADKQLGMTLDNKKLCPVLGNTVIKDRATRMEYLSVNLSGGILITKLSEVASAGKPMRKKLESAAMVCVTSQELDRLGESAEDGDETRLYMESVLERLQAAIRRLAASGFEAIVITADHGFLFDREVDSGMKMDAPGGQTWLVHPRCWVGIGGKQVEGALRLPFSHLGIIGDGEAVFPRGTAVFKAKGASYSYMHGGISPQEMILPSLVLKPLKPNAEMTGESKVEIKFAKKAVTNRFFSVQVTLHSAGLFEPQPLKVSMALVHGKDVVGHPAMAAHGFDEATHEVVLEPEKENPVTMMLQSGKSVSTIRIQVKDARTGVLLAEKTDIPVNLSF